MPKTILCTIDFSDSSNHAVRCAVEMAQDLNAHLTLLYIYRLPRMKGDDVVAWKKSAELQAVQNFSLLENTLLKGKGISYDFKTEVGFVADRIEAHTRQTSIGFLVIDKHMREESKESFDDLMENVKVPTVIVP